MRMKSIQTRRNRSAMIKNIRKVPFRKKKMSIKSMKMIKTKTKTKRKTKMKRKRKTKRRIR